MKDKHRIKQSRYKNKQFIKHHRIVKIDVHLANDVTLTLHDISTETIECLIRDCDRLTRLLLAATVRAKEFVRAIEEAKNEQ